MFLRNLQYIFEIFTEGYKLYIFILLISDIKMNEKNNLHTNFFLYMLIKLDLRRASNSTVIAPVTNLTDSLVFMMLVLLVT